MSITESLPEPLTQPVPATGPVVVRGEWSMIEQLLAEQQQLTAVELFSRNIEHQGPPAQSRYYSRLMPATAPGPDEQYAFEVDLDRCSGCKACVTACHSLNGLDDSETFRQVGMLIGGTAALPVLQHVTTACHHCLEPACATACPVDAYHKDPITGLVIHLDDQCFGCQYCTLACPYDVPQYHAGKGIVRKCDMCRQRLTAGEAPACVQACPHEAIQIRVVSRQQVSDDCETGQFLPGAYDPQFTLPTTSYKSSRPLPRNLVPADYYDVSPAHIHWSLVWMLVLTQLSVGVFGVELWLTSEWNVEQGWTALLPEHLSALQLGQVSSVSAWLIGQLALAAATLHLGRPHLAYRAVIGLRHSWLSREIVAFGLFAALSSLYATGAWAGTWWMGSRWTAMVLSLGPWLAVGVVASGLVGVYCSAMIYEYTQREYWSGTTTIQRFLGTAVLLGAGSVLMLQGFTGSIAATQLAWLVQLLYWGTLWKLGLELLVLRHLRDRSNSTLKRSALLLTGPLQGWFAGRLAAGLLGGIVLPPWLQQGDLTPTQSLLLTGLIGTLLFAGELIERCLFFAAVIPHRMPRGVRS